MPFQYLRSGSGGVTPSGVYTVSAPHRRPELRAGRVSGHGVVSATQPGSNPGGVDEAGSGGLLGNPNWPCQAGAEVLPVKEVAIPIDTGSEYLLDFPLPATSVGAYPQAVWAEFEARLGTNRWAAFDLYGRGSELPNDDVIEVVLPLRAATGGANAALGGGAATYLGALSSSTPSAGYAVLDGSLAAPTVALWFDPAELENDYPSFRVLNVGLRFLAWRDISAAPTVGEGLNVSLFDTDLSASDPDKLYGSWAVTDYENDAEMVTRWLGEVNFCARGKPASPGFPNEKHPFTILDLGHMKAADGSVGLIVEGVEGFDGQTTVYLTYVEMVVRIAPERRLATVARHIDGGTSSFIALTNDVELRYSLNSAFPVTMSGGPYTLAVREATPADPSDRYRAAPIDHVPEDIDGVMVTGELFTAMEAVGPGLRVLGVLQSRSALAAEIAVRVGTFSDGVLVGVPKDLPEHLLAVTAYVPGANVAAYGTWWVAYKGFDTNAAMVEVSTYFHRTRVLVDGATTFDYIKVLAYPDEITSADLNIFVHQPDGTGISYAFAPAAAVRALPPVGGKYREFALLLVPPITPAAGYVWLYPRTTSGLAAPWWLAVADPIHPYASYDPANTTTTDSDFALVLLCALNPIAAPTLSVETEAINVYRNATCGVTNIEYVEVAWVADDMYDEYAVERSIDGVAWIRVARLDNTFVHGAAVTFDDLSAPWDVPIHYRVVGFREPDQMNEISAVSTPVGPLSSGGALLGLSAGTTMSVYAPTTDAGRIELTWTDLTPGEIVALSGENLNRIFHAPEGRGLSVSVPVLVSWWRFCQLAEVLGDDLAIGAYSLDPTPFNDLRLLSYADYVDVRFPGGHTRTMALQLGGLSVVTQHGMFRAELILTDVAVDLEFFSGGP